MVFILARANCAPPKGFLVAPDMPVIGPKPCPHFRPKLRCVFDEKTRTFILLCRDCELEIDRKKEQEKSYSAYLKTPHWHELKSRKLKIAGFKCQLCNAKQSLEVHHRSYANLGNEPLEDLIVLCRNCHEVFHRERRLAR